MSDDIDACAEIVHRADPERFRATMMAPLGLREKLLVLYAFNAEVARAPWVASEPIIGEMRLQWWHDALEEIASGAPVRRHEVVTPLTGLLSPASARRLQNVVQARRWDIHGEPFTDEAALWAHLEAGFGALVVTALELAGAPEPERWLRAGAAMGLASWFEAVPALETHGKHPLPSECDVAALAGEGLALLRKPKPKGIAKKALLVGWRAAPLLRQAMRHPERVQTGLALSPFQSQIHLIRNML